MEKSDWTSEERTWLLNYLENADGPELKELMQKLFLSDAGKGELINTEISAKLLNTIHQNTIPDKSWYRYQLTKKWMLRATAACVISLLAFSVIVLVKNDRKKNSAKVSSNRNRYKNDVAPGGDKATLTLADGSVIMLDDTQNGTVAQQGSTKVIKLNGKLNYHVSAASVKDILYNTIATPRGGQYQVKLPDGSMVWLNAASSLHFPTAFTGKERRVEVSGEVYFEVAKNKSMPFIVSMNGAEIYVTGTHFNVMAYDDESTIQTTLLEGSVRIVKDASTMTLRPGQQSQLSKDGKVNIVDDIDIDKVVAWKNGFFDFDGLDFKTVAKQLSRWYDAEVVYNRKINDLFYAQIPRDTKLSDVLKALELTGKVHFEIEGRKIIVMPSSR